jgi:Putative Ig domain
MKRNGFSSPALAVSLIAALLAVLPGDTLAQSRARLAAKTQKAWLKAVKPQCASVDAACAQAAIVQTEMVCAESGKFYSRGSTAWQWISFALIIASSASTAVGASATVSNAKIWSTLGGTTGLGAVTTNINANVSSDQNGLAAVEAAHQKFLTLVTQEFEKAAPNYALIYAVAPSYATECVLAVPSTPAKQQSGFSITTATLPTGTQGIAYGPVSLAVTGGTAPYTWALASGNLPAGLTPLTPAGVISGTPTAANAPAGVKLTFKVTDSSAPTPQAATVTLVLTIN